MMEMIRRGQRSQNVKFLPKVEEDPSDLEEYESLFHGSYTVVDTPEYRISTAPLEFGDGFYTMPDPIQAYDWSKQSTAKNMANRFPGDQRAFIPVANAYKFEVKKARKELNILVFNEPCLDWMHFIIDSYSRKQKKWADVVIGPMSDDSFEYIVRDYLEDVKSGADVDEYYYLDRFKEHATVNQVLFANKKSLNYLKYMGFLMMTE